MQYEEVSTTGREYREQKAARVITRALRAYAYWRALQRAKATLPAPVRALVQGTCGIGVGEGEGDEGAANSTVGMLVALARGQRYSVSASLGKEMQEKAGSGSGWVRSRFRSFAIASRQTHSKGSISSQPPLTPTTPNEGAPDDLLRGPAPRLICTATGTRTGAETIEIRAVSMPKPCETVAYTCTCASQAESSEPTENPHVAVTWKTCDI